MPRFGIFGKDRKGGEAGATVIEAVTTGHTLDRKGSLGDKEPYSVVEKDVPEDELAHGEDIIAAHEEFTEKEYKRLMWKVDGILVPLLMIIYGLQYSDKTSLSSGVVFGLPEDTGVTPAEFANLSSFFYMSYAIAQYPMAWVLQRFPLGRALAVCVILWGAMVMCLGACNTYAQLAAVRVLLGWFESVITPGFAIFTTAWYLRREQGLRQALYYSMNAGFGMIFGVGIYYIAMNQQQNGGLAGWRVINLFLGGVTVGMGIIFLILGGTPDEVWWLSKRQKRMAKARIVSNATGGGEQHPWKWEQVRECFRDPQYYFAMLFGLLGNIPNGALTTFMNLIFKGLGFTSLETIIYALPMQAICLVLTVVSAVVIRYYPKMRFPIGLLACADLVFVLFFVGFANVGKWAKWGVFILSQSFSIGTFVVAWPLLSINVAGRTKKSFFAATSLLVYCVGNIVGSQVMRPSDAPLYHVGLTVCACCMIANMINLCCWWAHYVRVNRKRQKAFEQSGLTEEERDHQNYLAGETDLTDIQNQFFRYDC